MTPEEMRVAILERMGFTSVQWQLSPFGERVVFGVRPDERTPQRIDLTLDLMHEAEKTLDDCQQNNYFSHLAGVGFHNSFVSRDKILEALRSTITQRAEAFCRTLWPERFHNLKTK